LLIYENPDEKENQNPDDDIEEVGGPHDEENRVVCQRNVLFGDQDTRKNYTGSLS